MEDISKIKLNRECFTTSYPHYNSLNAQDVSSLFRKKPINIYVHIPFCTHKCDFCYYFSQVPRGASALEEYANYLIQEIKMIKSKLNLENYYMDTLYFGGGTPTILNEKQFEKITSALYETFSVNNDFEFCVEVRPGPNVTDRKLALLKELKVKRLSIGIQSLNDKVLIENGRHHTTDEFYKTIDRARKAGFSWINCDLMSGMLYDDINTFMDSLKKLTELNLENISIYKMEVFYNTKIYQKIRRNTNLLDSNSLEIEQVKKGKQFLESTGYEMSNNSLFIKDKAYIHRHRMNIQYNAEMLGIGLTAVSYLHNHIFQNHIKFNSYYTMLDRNELPIYRAKALCKSDEICRYFVMGFKNLILYRENFYENFGVDLFDTIYGGIIKQMGNKNILEVNEKLLRINDDYRIFADDIARVFYSDDSEIRMETHVVRKQ